MDHRLYLKAIEYYLKFLHTGQGWVEDNIAACGKLEDIYHHLGDEAKERKYAFKSFEYNTPRTEFCCRIGFQFMKNHDLRKAAFWYKLATELEKTKDSWGFINEAFWTWLPHIQLSICYYRMGDLEKTYLHNEKARSYNPKHDNILSNKRFYENLLKKNLNRIKSWITS